jgi:hypothetical protein
MKGDEMKLRNKQAGQSMLEYLVATAVVVAVFFGEPTGPGSSLFSVVAGAIGVGYSNFYTSISVPN